MLHAALASARVHLSEELEPLQKELASLVAHTNSRMREAHLPQVMECETPIFFLPVGTPNLCANLCSRLLREGLHVQMGIFPAVPLRAGGLRFCVHRGLTTFDIDRLIDRMQYHYSHTLKEAGSSCEHVAKVFGLEPFSLDAA
jgi:7-keto-8-aminopelargonate synthetase-like enzyme